MYGDVARRYIAQLKTISYIPAGVTTVTAPTVLMSEMLPMYIDSTIPFLYLPVDICEKFASAFGLQYNTTNEIYTINSTMHTTILNMDPSITFTMATTAGQTLDFVLPYSAFDLNATFPVLADEGDSAMFFPLKRADNDTQYTLGRVFLQEA